MTIVRIAHAGMGRWRGIKPGAGRRFPRWVWIGLSLLLASAAMLHPAGIARASQYAQYPFLGGLLLGALNPLHLPFWLGWTAVLRAKNILGGGRREYHLFSAAIGAGTALAFLAYGLAGHVLLRWLADGYRFARMALG
jgi:threonine/homoserine/homoserine lactone efflux protein